MNENGNVVGNNSQTSESIQKNVSVNDSGNENLPLKNSNENNNQPLKNNDENKNIKKKKIIITCSVVVVILSVAIAIAVMIINANSNKKGVGEYDAKPVLYLYPSSKTNVTVSFEKPYLLTTTYPKFKNNWKVTANPNGDLYDLKGNYYYGLYWEESGSTDVDFTEGFYVTKASAIEFLEEKLSIIGLNPKERNEFIMYWLPILEKNEKSLVYFELTEERDKYNKLIINPKPDSMLRLAIHVKRVDSAVDIKEQKLPSFERKGFTVVEWGGVIH